MWALLLQDFDRLIYRCGGCSSHARKSHQNGSKSASREETISVTFSCLYIYILWLQIMCVCVCMLWKIALTFGQMTNYAHKDIQEVENSHSLKVTEVNFISSIHSITLLNTVDKCSHHSSDAYTTVRYHNLANSLIFNLLMESLKAPLSLEFFVSLCSLSSYRFKIHNWVLAPVLLFIYTSKYFIFLSYLI
jgi:hypothetical protein